MAKQRSGKAKAKHKAKDKAKRKQSKRARWAELERRLDDLAREHARLRKRLHQLTNALERPPKRGFPPPWVRRRGGPPPWAKGVGPVVSLEVPLETHDPAAPLWASVAARLPEEVTTVDDAGRIVRYRYSAAGSTPQAPLYRRIAEPVDPPDRPPTGSPETFRG